MDEIQALQQIADELYDLFWLIFWFGVLGVFKTTIDRK